MRDFRGKYEGERPTLKQLVEWAAKAQAAPRGATNGDKDHASHRQPAPVVDTHDNEHRPSALAPRPRPR